MSSKLTVIFYIILCLEAGVMLTFLPWVHPFGLVDWGDNFFLLYASQKMGLQGLQNAVASGWVRGAVTGLGLLNLAMAFWEIAHFRRTVRSLNTQADASVRAATTTTTAASIAPPSAADTASADASQRGTTHHLPDYERRDDPRDHSGE